MPRGKFIVLEGPDGSGKTTQAKKLYSHLGSKGIPVCLTREPGGPAAAEAIRSFALENTFSPILDVCLMYTARLLHLRQTIEPLLEDGVWVVCDRFISSTWAYQCHLSNRPGVDPQLLWKIECDTYAALPSPDLEIFLSVSLEESAARIKSRGEHTDRFEQGLRHIRAAYNYRYLQFPPTHPVRLISAESIPDTVAEEIALAVVPLLPGDH